MKLRDLVLPFLAACLLSPAAASAQVVEDDEAEHVAPRIKAVSPPPGADSEESAKRIVRRTNDFRKAEGLQTVDVDSKLAETAQYFAEFMARTDKYGHNADGNRPSGRAKKHGYDYCLVSENIAYQYRSDGFTTEKLAQGFFEGWKDSPGHRKNMLDPDVTQTGVAVARSEATGTYYAVQMFGRPKSMTIEFVFANRSETAVNYKIADRTFSLPPQLIRTHRRCRPTEVTFHWPGKDGDSRAVQPSNGDRFVVVRANGMLQLEKE